MRRGLSTLGGIGLAIIVSQFPEYAQQYTQRLGGAVDELRIVIDDFDSGARGFGLSRDEALARYGASADQFLVDRGTAMQRTLARYDQLSGTLTRVQGAGSWERLRLLPSFFDTEVGGRTIDNFKPAVPVTLEGFAYAGIGAVVGYALVWGLTGLLLLPFRRRRRLPVPHEI